MQTSLANKTVALFLGMIMVWTIGCDLRTTEADLLSKILRQSKDPLIQKILDNKSAHELQILYTPIEKDQNGNPYFKEHAYQVDAAKYFYPASTVKLPVAILAMQKVRALQRQGIEIDPETPFKIFDPQNEVWIEKDSTHPQGKRTLSHLIKKLFLVSDNQAYNDLFDFLGRDYINNSLKEKGIDNIRIQHKFSNATNNDLTPQLVFYSEENKVLYQQQPIAASREMNSNSASGLLKGKGFMKEGELIDNPMDFSQKNYASLQALNQILKRVIFPEQFPKAQRFELAEDDYAFLKFWMSRTPTEVDVPFYDREYYYDSYCKFLMYGDQKGAMTDQIRIYNKVGLAYGTLTDVAYINDHRGTSFLLAATLLVNQNEIFNDGVYEYDEAGIPFLAALGRAIYAHQAQNKN